MIGELFQIIKPVELFELNQQQTHFSFIRKPSKGLFLLLEENVACGDFSKDTSDVIKDISTHHQYKLFKANGVYRIMYNGDEIDLSSFFVPITWCHRILMTNKSLYIPSEDFDVYMKNNHIYLHEEETQISS